MSILSGLQKAKKSAGVMLRVEKISLIITFDAAILILIGLAALGISLCVIVFSIATPGASVDQHFIWIAVIGFLVLSYGLFLWRVAQDFHGFKSWTYGWAAFLLLRHWVFINWKDLFNEDVRRAFN